jgi:DMSO/TMAO reductase YedYZ heme-binding membrane subunit
MHRGVNKMKKQTKITLFVFAAIVVAFVVFSILASFHTHTCVGDDCPVCQLIDNIRRLLGIASFTLFCSHVSVALIVSKAICINNERCESPVVQRVKIIS